MTSLSTLTIPVSESTVTSANCAANGGGDTGDTYEATPMICSWLFLCNESSAISVNGTALPSGAMACRFDNRIFEYSDSGNPRIIVARTLIRSAHFSAALTAAVPEMYVVDDAYAPLSKGVKSVSEQYVIISSRGTPNTSAAICAKTVSEPVPKSVAPTRRLKEPSSFSLIEAPPISR